MGLFDWFLKPRVMSVPKARDALLLHLQNFHVTPGVFAKMQAKGADKKEIRYLTQAYLELLSLLFRRQGAKKIVPETLTQEVLPQLRRAYPD